MRNDYFFLIQKKFKQINQISIHKNEVDNNDVLERIFKLRNKKIRKKLRHFYFILAFI